MQLRGLLQALLATAIAVAVLGDAGSYSAYDDTLGYAFVLDRRGGFSGAPLSTRLRVVDVATKTEVWTYAEAIIQSDIIAGVRDGKLVAIAREFSDNGVSGSAVLELDAATGAFVSQTFLTERLEDIWRPVLLPSGELFALEITGSTSFFPNNNLSTLPRGLSFNDVGEDPWIFYSSASAVAEAVYLPYASEAQSRYIRFDAVTGSVAEGSVDSPFFSGGRVASDASDPSTVYVSGVLEPRGRDVGVVKLAADLSGGEIWRFSASLIAGEDTFVVSPGNLLFLGDGYTLLPVDFVTSAGIGTVSVGGETVSLPGGKSILLLFLDPDGMLVRATARRPEGVADDEGWELTREAFYYSRARGTVVLTGELPLNDARLPNADEVDINGDLDALGIRD